MAREQAKPTVEPQRQEGMRTRQLLSRCGGPGGAGSRQLGTVPGTPLPFALLPLWPSWGPGGNGSDIND